MGELKTVVDGGAPFSNESKIVRVIYDFAVEGGAQGLFDILKADTVDDVVIKSAYVRGITTLTGVNMVMDWGSETLDPNGLLADEVVGSFTAGALVNIVAPGTPIKIPAGEKVQMEIKTADLTAGKCEFIMEVAKF